jgi:Mycothiol maleylpyruvate isomerase N-terminal domain
MRHTRESVIDRTRREFAKLERLVARLRPADWKRPVPRPPTRDPWTIQDALAHIVYWKAHTARVIRGERRPPEMRGLDVNQINRLIYERWRHRKPAEVVDWHGRVHDEVLRTLADTSEEWFGRRARSAHWPADLDGHSAAHRVKDIEAALASSSPSRAPRRTRRSAMRSSATSGDRRRS